MYAIIENNIPRLYTVAMFKSDNPNLSFRKVPSDEMLAEYNIYPVVDNVPLLAENEEITGDSLSWDGSIVTKNYTVAEIMPLAEYQAAKTMDQDVNKLLMSGKDTVLVLVELIDYLLANTPMAATHFTPNVRQAYQDLKVIAERVKQG